MIGGRELESRSKKLKDELISYIERIKTQMPVDFFTIVNPTVICNPYVSDFALKFFQREAQRKKPLLSFLRSASVFYLRQFCLFAVYIVQFVVYRAVWRRKTLPEDAIFIDIFLLTDKIVSEGRFEENYFTGLYEVLEKYGIDYVFLPRIYGSASKNPFKMIEFFRILRRDQREFLFEFDMLSCLDLLSIGATIGLYPFKTLRLYRRGELSDKDAIFNAELIVDIGRQSFDAFSRYVYSRNIAERIERGRIYSWCEFQVVDRSFNFGIRTHNDEITLYGCQLFLDYENYFNSVVYDIDYTQKTSPHIVLVNGRHYLQKRELVSYRMGVSLRYRQLFERAVSTGGDSVLVLGSYNEADTKYMLKCAERLDRVMFKNHPAVDIAKLGKIDDRIESVSDNIYDLFAKTAVVLATASGTAVEAVASGVTVIVVASRDGLTANPLVEYGKGEIWDIAFTPDEVEKVYNRLLDFRRRDAKRIEEIALWYRDNFFVEPTEANIIKAFELEKKDI